MNIDLYQIFYKEEQRQFIEPCCTAYENKPSVLAETEIYVNEWNKGFDKDRYTGFLSWKFNQKAGVSAQYFIDLCKSTQEKKHFDFYAFTPAIFNAQYDQFNGNIWTQGEHWHPGIIEYTKRVFDELNWNTDEIMHTKIKRSAVFWSNYFIANYETWEDIMVNWYLPVYNKCFELSAKYPKYTTGNAVAETFLTFIMERVMITYLNSTNKKFIVFY